MTVTTLMKGPDERSLVSGNERHIARTRCHSRLVSQCVRSIIVAHTSNSTLTDSPHVVLHRWRQRLDDEHVGLAAVGFEHA
jgi:hypothetical protein